MKKYCYKVPVKKMENDPPITCNLHPTPYTLTPNPYTLNYQERQYALGLIPEAR